jgi:hypothetical protein
MKAKVAENKSMISPRMPDFMFRHRDSVAHSSRRSAKCRPGVRFVISLASTLHARGIHVLLYVKTFRGIYGAWISTSFWKCRSHRQNWNKITETLHTCDNGKFRHDIFWGVNTADNGPVIVPSKVLREHVHFLGDSGSGKTSLGISPLLAQLMQFGDASVIVIDLKADDQTLFEVMREGARINSHQPENTQLDSADWSYPFRYFTPDRRSLVSRI